MTAWEIIKSETTAHKTVGTVGYQLRLNLAAQIFVSLLPFLKARENEEKIFNKDMEVRDAILNKKYLDKIGIETLW